MTVFRFFVSVLLLCGLSHTALAQIGNASYANDSVLIDMERAYARKDKTRLTELLPAASGHPLEVYAAYWELKARLESASSEEIRQFLQRWQGSYFEDRLRNDWLLLLGETGDSANFAREYPLFRMRDDAQVLCWAAHFGLLNDVQQVMNDWYTQKSSSTACESAASKWLASGKISAAQVWRKVRLAAEANQLSSARSAAQLLDPFAADQLRIALSRPQATLSKALIAPEQAVALVARLAAVDPEQAILSYESYLIQTQDGTRPTFTQAQKDWIWGVVGKQSAMNLSPAALSYYSNAKSTQDWSDDMLAWRVRAALRAGLAANAPVILQSIASMSPKAQQDAAWLYWKARALASTGKKADVEEAQNLYRAIASTNGFYEMLALEESGAPIQLPLPPPKPTAADIDKIRKNPGFARALYAMQVGLRTFGVREWNYTAHLHEDGGLPTAELLAAAEVACQYEIWDRCINTSERIPGAFAHWQRFPTPHKAEVMTHSANVGLDPAYVYGLIRQESRFVIAARSGVGASGLMQIMPKTASWTARKIGLIGFTRDQIYDSNTNVLIGVSYLNLALQSFQNSKPLAAAAYNAGPSRARRWREGAGALEGAIWAENIPFNETRDYVKKVLTNTTLYSVLLTGKPQSLKAQLGTVGPAPIVTIEEIPNADLP